MVKAEYRSDDGFDRKPWPDGEWLGFKVVNSEVRPKFNKEEGDEVSLTCEALDGDVAGQWAYLNISHLNKRGGVNLVFEPDTDTPLSKWAQVLVAVNPGFDPANDEAHPELEDLRGGFFEALIEPAKNPKYCKFLKFRKMGTAALAKNKLNAEVEEVVKSKHADKDIPF